LFLSKKPQDSFKYVEINDYKKYTIGITDNLDLTTIKHHEINSDVWVLLPSALSKIYTNILSKSIRLEEIVGKDNIFNGIQTSANDIYIFIPNHEDADFYYFSKNNVDYKVEKEFTKPYFQTSRGEDNLFTYRLLKPNARVVYPYYKISDRIELYSLKQIKKDFPFSYKYIIAHKDILNNPKRDIKPEPDNPDECYRYGRHQSL
jgi:hypothetical protein